MAKIGTIQEISIADLKPYDKNAKMHGKEQVDLICKSIQEFGFLNPCLIDKQKRIIAGHGRVMAAKQLGWDKIPCLYVEGLTEEQRRAYILADNRLTELGEWDMNLVVEELKDLKDLDFDISLTGFDIDLEAQEEIEEDEYEEPENIEPRAKLGDIYQLGSHRLMCGDSTSITDVEKLLGGASVDMVFTDPPYRMDAQGGSNQWVGRQAAKLGESIKEMCDFNPSDFLNVLLSVFDGGMNSYIFCNKDLVPDYLNWAVENNFAFNILFWKKPNALPLGGQHRPDVEYLIFIREGAIWNNGIEGVSYSKCLEYSRENSTPHPTMKPIGLIANELMISSNKNSNVLDLFGGSGSTLIACEQSSRNCYMMELDAHYVDVIIDRWEKLTNKKAVLLNAE